MPMLAALVPKTVIDDLEAVHVDEHDSEQGFVALRHLDGVLQPVLEQRPVRQTGQRIMVGEIMNFLLLCLALLIFMPLDDAVGAADDQEQKKV